MKNTILLLFTLFYASLALGQNTSGNSNILWSKRLDAKKKMTLSQVIGGDETGIYVTKTTIKDNIRGNYALPILEHYDQNLSLIKSQELKISNREGRLIYENIFQMDGNLYLFYSLVNIWKQSITLMLQPLDKVNLGLSGNAIKITETKLPALLQRDQFTDFNFEFSGDETSLLLFHSSPSAGNKPVQIKLFVFDNKMNLDWSKEVTVPYEDKLFEPKSYYLDNNKNVYLLGKKYHNTRADKKSGKPNFNYVLLSYFEKGADSSSYDIDAEGKFLTDMKIAVNNYSEIICSGFYSNEGTSSIEWKDRLSEVSQKHSPNTLIRYNNSSISGSFYLKLEPGTHKIKKQSYNEFTVDFLTQNMTDEETQKTIKQIEKGKHPEMYSYKLDDLIIRENGSITLVGEQMEEITTRRTSPYSLPGQPAPISPSSYSSNTTTSIHHSFTNIIVVHFSPEGNFEWSESIAKKQHTSNDFGFFSSYAMAKGNDNTYFIFNDHPKNLQNKDSGKLKNFNPRLNKDFLVVLVTLDAEGNKSKTVLPLGGKSSVLFKPAASKQISLNQMILFGQYKKNFSLAKFDFEEPLSY